MDIAVFSDIHGNYVAFEACLQEAKKRKLDTFLFLGDYVGEFPYPEHTMEMLYTLKEHCTCYFVRGNKEDYWINHGKSDRIWKEGSSSTGALQYTFTHLTDKDLDFFREMSICEEVAVDGMKSLLICHGSPDKNNEKLLPDQEKTKLLMQNCRQDYILCGHTHICQTIEMAGKVVWNPGAVGVSLHSEGKAQFMVLHSVEKEWQAEFIAVDYDGERVIREIKEAGLLQAAPYWSQITIHLIQTGEVSHGAILQKAMEYCREATGECVWYDIPEQYWEKAVREKMVEKQ